MDLTSGVQNLQITKDVNSNKREDYLEWRDYFMATALLAAKRSKDPSTQVGACIVSPDNKIVGIGYNGMPIGCHDDDFPWGKTAETPYDNKYLYVCHAEMNAILNKNVHNVEGCSLYVVLFPCNECAKIIIQSKIKELYYISDKDCSKDMTRASKRMLDAAKIAYHHYVPKVKQITLNFDEIKHAN